MKNFRSITFPQRLLAFLFLMLFVIAGSVSWGQCITNTTNWDESGILNTTGQGCDGNSYVFNANGDFITSPVVTSPTSMTFQRRRSSNTTAWSMDIQISTNAAYSTWTTVSTLSSITTTCASATINLSAYTGLRKIRFIDTRGSGAHERTISDIEVTCAPTCTAQTITAITSSVSKFVGDANYSAATSSTSGLTLSYSSSNTAVATVSAAGVVTILAAGTTTITVAQAGNATYCAATSVTQSLTVTNPPCTTPNALAFDVQPTTVVQNATMASVKVKAICSATGLTATTYTGSIKLKLNTGCGFEYNGTIYAPGTDISVNAVAGIATFANIKFLRSAQSNLNFTATATSMSSVTSSNFNVTVPGGTSVTTTIIQNDFDANTAWAYPSIVSSTYANGEGGVAEVSVVSESGTNVLRKRHTSNNGSGETGSQSTVTFDNVTGLSAYDEVTFFFNVLSFGSGGSSSGAGNDVNEDFWLEVSTNNGSSWTTILTEEGSSNRLFAQSATPVTALSLSSNLTLGSGDSKSAFKLVLTGISQFRFRFTAKNNRTQENWAIDNVKLTGFTHTAGTTFALPAAEAEAETAVCNDGSGIDLSVDITSFQPNLTYSWTPTATLVNPTSQNPVAFPTTATQTYTVVVTDAHHCKVTDNVLVTNTGFGGTAGLWTGQFSTDWFDCRNWSDRKIPVATTAVTINQTASNDCEIDEFEAVCASLLLTSTNGTENNLTLTTTGKLTVTNGVSITNSGSGDIQLELQGTSRLTCEDLTIDGVSNGDAKLKHELASTLVTVNGNLTIQPGGELDLSDGNNGTPGGIVHLKGNFTNNATETDFKQDESTVIFNGTVNQDISIAGTNTEIFYNLTSNKTAGTLILSDNIQITNQLTMTAGNIDTQTSILELGSSTTVRGTLSHTSGYVLGKMKRWFSGTNSGNASSLFPMGFDDSGIKNRNVSVEYTSAPTAGNLTVQFIPTNMGMDGIPLLAANSGGAGFDVTSTEDEGYWKIDNVNLTNGAYKITCTGEGFGTIADISKLTLLKRVGTGDWLCPGTHLTPAGTTSVPVLSRSGVTGWSNFGFGGGTINPLPVELVSFTASCGDQTLLRWSTASESNSDYFSVEKTADGIEWQEIGQVKSAGNTSYETEYQLQDRTSAGNTVYYRLSQFDFDGTRKTYQPISANCGSEIDVNVFPNPNNGNFTVSFKTSSPEGTVYISIVSSEGKLIHQQKIDAVNGNTSVEFNHEDLQPGVYFVTVSQENNNLKTIKMVRN